MKTAAEAAKTIFVSAVVDAYHQRASLYIVNRWTYLFNVSNLRDKD